jgi:DNA-binding transcriptional regulator YiaG
MKKHNLNQPALAALLHVSASTVYRWIEEGSAIPFAVIELLRLWDRDADAEHAAGPKPTRKRTR